MTRHHFRFAVAPIVLALACFAAARAEAQQTAPPAAPPATTEPGRVHSFEIAVGGELLTSQNLGSATATMTTPGGSAYNYFSLAGTRTVAPAFRGRVGYQVTSMLTIEGGLVIARSNVEGTVTGDAEGATAPVLTDQLTQYFVDVSGLLHLRQFAFLSGAGVPFLEVGGGYLRQLHEGGFAIDTGQIYHFGGGATYMFSHRPGRGITGYGIRADARVYVPRKGYHFGQTQSLFAAIGGSLVVAF